MILLIDNYDSFTYNLVQRLGEIDPTLNLEVHRNDRITVESIEQRAPTHIIISPGPCTPREAGISCEVVEKLGPKIPLLGVCLGHQSIAHAMGGEVVRADRLMHGKTDMVHHDGSALFACLASPFQATRYHSLIVKPGTLPDGFEVSAWCIAPNGEREIMALRHQKFPKFGVQFHPESFLTLGGIKILENFLAVK